MDSKTLVLQHLDEVHAIESALVTNLTAHVAMTTDDEYRGHLEDHLEVTRRQVVAIARRSKALGGRGPGRNPLALPARLVRGAVGQALVLTKGPLDLLRTPDQSARMLKNARDEAMTEALEIAAYDALETIAKAGGDQVTARLAAEHRKQEEEMLVALRGQIARLAVATFEARTGDKAKSGVKSGATRKATAAVG